MAVLDSLVFKSLGAGALQGTLLFKLCKVSWHPANEDALKQMFSQQKKKKKEFSTPTRRLASELVSYVGKFF